MSKKIAIGLVLVMCTICFGLVYVFTYVPPISEQHGIVESKLYMGQAEKQPLIVAFGGGGGGDWWLPLGRLR